MKTRGFWIVLFLAIISLLVFQAIWLNNVYEIEKKDLYEKINKSLTYSIEKELNNRIKNQLKDESIIFDTQTDSSKRSMTLDNEEILEAGIHQQALYFLGYYFNFDSLDIIFQNELQKIGVPLNYYLSYKDSTKAIITQAGNLSLSTSNDGFLSESRLIVEGKRVQAFVNISTSAVFKKMFGLLTASVIMFVIIILCIFIQTKTIFSQIKINKLREDFNNALTHDMRTPLGTINMILSNFRSGLLDNNPIKREEYGKLAMEEVDGLVLLVERILTIAKLEKDKHAINPTETDIHAIIKEVKERFAFSNQKKVIINTSVSFDKDEKLLIDGILIKDALSNLVENAIKYSDDSVVIHIRCYESNNQLYVTVEDNGFGISKKNKKIIFEIFERGAATGKKGIRGFGLGLCSVKRIAEAHGGIVKLFSNEGEGSEFSIVIPLPEPKDLTGKG